MMLLLLHSNASDTLTSNPPDKYHLATKISPSDLSPVWLFPFEEGPWLGA
jgi:hypothetical protein